MTKVIVKPPFKPLNAPFPYFGGKSRLAATIISRLPKHKTYAEVFGGAAWILFRKRPGTLEALNDLDRHLMNFYRVAKYHSEALAAEIATLQPGREMFYALRAEIDRPMFTDVQRAAAYYYLQRYAFAGRPNKPTLAISPSQPLRCRSVMANRVLPLISARLTSVMLENLPWERFIKLYDGPDTFFFIDPPYMGHVEYRHNLEMDDFVTLAATLPLIKGKFLLTHTDCPEIRELLKGFHFEEVQLSYTAHQMTQGRKRLTGHEVLVSNYRI